MDCIQAITMLCIEMWIVACEMIGIIIHMWRDIFMNYLKALSKWPIGCLGLITQLTSE